MSNSTRKRAAPGATPMVPRQTTQQAQPAAYAPAPADQMVRWNAPPAAAADPMLGYVDAAPGSYELVQAGQRPQFPGAAGTATPSNSLTRRAPAMSNPGLMPDGSVGGFDPAWASFLSGATAGGDDAVGNTSGTLVPLHHDDVSAAPGEENIDDMEERAQKAKREALAKRKQIPPFVQKLSSFLEEGKNEDLIRWSNKGDSFIVLDEDEFAKTLIPELFKHNNYASFVRQLNMYGFHKRVGLSDNSMRASERKNKSPSEYSNPYFRRGHPNLLWLINKPKSGAKGAKKTHKSEEPESDDEHHHHHHDDHQPQHHYHHAPKALPAASAGPGSGGVAPGGAAAGPGTGVGGVAGASTGGEGGLPRKEMALIREELKQVREQQQLISRTITHLQQNNRDLYNQALLFQTQHDRHQNSINAILHFLATLFRKSLEEQGGSQSAGDILSSILATQTGAASNTQQGTVVDLGDLFAGSPDAAASAGSSLATPPHQRARGLLPPIPDANAGRAATTTPRGTGARRGGATAQGFGGSSNRYQPETGQVTELADTASPPTLRQELEANPQEQMMRIINDHNSANSLGLDLPEAADIVAGAPQNLDSAQRDQLANLMSRQNQNQGQGQQRASTTSSASAAPTPRTRQTASATPRPSASNAPTPTAARGGTPGAPSLSPIMHSPAMPPLSMGQISSNQSELERLQELQTQQDARINELSGMLGPLSPSGRVPPLDDTGNNPSAAADLAGAPPNYFDPQGVDLDQYFDSAAFLADGGGVGDDFDFGDPVDPTGAGAVPPVKTEAEYPATVDNTPSPAVTEEVPRDDLVDSSKRRRVG